MPCSICWKDEELITVHIDNNVVEQTKCIHCINNLLANRRLVYFKWEYYSEWHPDIMWCSICSAPMHREFWASSGGKCLHCAKRNWYTYCPQCGIMHKNWMCDGWIQDAPVTTTSRISFAISNDSKSRDPKGWSVWATDYIKKIWQYQTERTLSSDTQEMLKKFYKNNKTFTHYYTREDVKITGTVKYNNVRMLSVIMDELWAIRMFSKNRIEDWKKLSKYHNCYLQGIDDNWLIRWKFIDIMWNVRERSESVNKFLQDIWSDATNASMTWEFRYVLSSNIEHKIKAFQLNEKVWSCQKTGNCDSYARWAYDAITNGCNCPILLYNVGSKEPFARITTRIMYDANWQEYILIDRLYHSWEFSDSTMKWEVYKAIVKDLKQQWYKVIASNYSAHDKSTYAYLASLWMKSDNVVNDLCQPLRRLIWSYWYYCDGWTVVRTWEIDWLQRATDYLDKAYVL